LAAKHQDRQTVIFLIAIIVIAGKVETSVDSLDASLIVKLT